MVCRCVYIGIKRGLGVEIFKLAGVLVSVFACVHYYSKLGSFLSKPELIPTEIGNFISFTLLFVISVFFCSLIREAFLLLVKLQPHPVLDKWIGAFLGGVRGIFLSGMILIVFIVSPVGFLDRGAKISFFGIYTFGTVAKTYTFMVDKLVKPFFPEEGFNEEFFEALGR